MRLEKIYKKAFEIGIANDHRGKTEIRKLLKEEKERFDALKKDEVEYYDKDKLFNPFSDTRVLNGNLNLDIKKTIVGIDMQVGEVLLTYLLNKELDQTIDLIISHHPESYALAQLFDVMKLQADLMAKYGVSISVAEQLMQTRISEIERRIMPVNHTRSVDVARLLGIPMMCIHTPADNCVTHHLKNLFEKKKPERLKDLIKILMSIPEYKKSAKLQVPPKIVNGSENNKCGKIFVEMTGGTEGAKEIFEKFANSGISTLVGMHYSEEHLENAKKAKLNVVVAGHVSSDVLGLNLLFDELEKEEKLEFVGVSGFERMRR
ncbi:MAG: NGG1p interacting factor NIF3 [Candidatus Aminicenantes bacterium]|nr:NGG1p interacting factor NIF3 [Candidatus Aminicenantes bacterium]MDH5385811.1 NGG1p interacting factor NIF3 [Candidatus Aminicenantes bacterium]